jgi:Asp-tRNA(Asn)/Glu-tRNA(Gln) amidotransferase A subunit family amidase
VSDDVAFASLRELGTRLRRREISSEEIVRIVIDRTQKLDPKLNSYITFLPEQALQQARAADDALRRGQDCGPLHGMPISLKDHIATAGVRTTAGAKFMLTNVPQADAAVAAKSGRLGIWSLRPGDRVVALARWWQRVSCPCQSERITADRFESRPPSVGWWA